MRSGYIIFILVLVLVITYFYKWLIDDDEGFISYTVENTTAAAACAPKTLVRDPVKPEVAQMGVGTIEPSTIVNSLPSTSYVPSRAASMPYRNPGTEPARYIQILSVLQQLQAFFGFEAPAIENECDPTVVLPLQQARSDMGQLLTQVDVLERNPGVPSTITMKELTQITSNIRYLQKEARKFKENTGTELLKTNVSTVENFEDGAEAEEDEAEGFESNSDSYPIEGFTSGSTSTPASIAELKAFRSAVQSTIKELKATTAGTTDAVIVKRLATLDRMRKDVDEIIQMVEDGTMKPSQVPIYSEDIKKMTKNLGSSDQIVGSIIRNVALPPALAKLFPSDLNMKDKFTLQEINKDLSKYLKDLTQGMSWTAKGDIGVELKYDSPNAIAQAATASPSQDDFVQAQVQDQVQAVTPLTDGQLTKSLNRISGLNKDGSRKILDDPPSGNFDWADRAQHICQQIRKRGMNPKDFGCLNIEETSEDYSWRGNVTLLCSRLEHTLDPGLPVACGCPPKEWAGWLRN
jgi:hypothetical protein